MEPNNQETKADEAVYLWVLSLSVGLAIGAGIGVAIGHIGAGIALGVGVGVAVGLFLYRRSTTNSSDDQPAGRRGADCTFLAPSHRNRMEQLAHTAQKQQRESRPSTGR